jgi:hypothetical protein
MSEDPKAARARRGAIARRLPDPNEILRASLITRYTTCGKPGCKCMRGQKHGPSYTASVTVGAGKTRQVYVRKDDVDSVRTWIDNYDKLWRGLVEISEINFELLRAKHSDRPDRRRSKPRSKR